MITPEGERKFMPIPSRFDRLARQQFLDLIAQGHSRTGAAKRLGFQRRTITTRMVRDPEFAAAVVEAEGEVLDEIEAKMMEKARAGHVEAGKFVLERRDPARWGPLSARAAVPAQAEEMTLDELADTAVTLIRTIIDKERKAAEAEPEFIDVESTEEPIPPVPQALPGQRELEDVNWDEALG